MKKWKLTYEQAHFFSAPITGQEFSVRCFPRALPSQQVQRLSCEILPAGSTTKSRDAFGNEIISGSIREAHDFFSVKMEALVWTENVVNEEKQPWYRLGMYRYGSALTRPGERIRAFLAGLPERGKQTDWERTWELLLALWENIRYLRGSTTIQTTAEQAFSQGCGVCQDYTHILLSLCRTEGMTARYVAGAIPGEGQTHAWLEVWQDGRWKGFDPTNRKETNEEYIILACGRDAWDCGINRGIFLGAARELQNFYVRMEEI